MAKMKRPIGDLVSGKLGNVVFVNCKGKSYVRSAPQRKKDSWSDLQLLYRRRLAAVAALWRSLKCPSVSYIWKTAAQQNNGYALFVKENIQALGIDGDLINPNLLSVTQGKLPILENLQITKDDALFYNFTLTWTNDDHYSAERMRDNIFAMVYSNGNFTPIIPSTLKRSDEGGQLVIPELVTISDPATLYIYIASEDEAKYSKSISYNIPEL